MFKIRRFFWSQIVHRSHKGVILKMGTRLLVGIFSLILSFFSQNIFSKSINIRQIVIFGDSYSDNGNTFNKSSNTYPGRAYFLGRFTNGLTWAEYLAIKLKVDILDQNVFRNYAYGQAQILGGVLLDTHNDKKSWSFSVPDLSAEIDEYLSSGNIEPANSIYFVFIGTNDLLNYKPSSKLKNKKFVNNLLEQLERQLERLKSVGANKIIIFNLRDLKRYPLSRELAEKYKHNYLETLEEMIQQFNQGVLSFYRNDDNVYIFNVYDFDYKVFSSVDSFPWQRQKLFLTNKDQACYIHGGNYVDYIYDKYCSTPWTHWFFDRIHPTTYIDFLLGDEVHSFLINKELVRKL